MENKIPWEQQFHEFSCAIGQLEESVNYLKIEAGSNELMQDVILAEIFKEGLIQQFEYTHDLACKVMKDYIEYQGNIAITGIKEATLEALKLKLISDEEIWMDMLTSREKLAQTFSEETAEEIYKKIIVEYYSEIRKFSASAPLSNRKV